MVNESVAALMNFAPIVLMLLIFYFLILRPQKKAQKERQEMLDSLKVGARVITIGGIYGTITKLLNASKLKWLAARLTALQPATRKLQNDNVTFRRKQIFGSRLQE